MSIHVYLFTSLISLMPFMTWEPTFPTSISLLLPCESRPIDQCFPTFFGLLYYSHISKGQLLFYWYQARNVFLYLLFYWKSFIRLEAIFSPISFFCNKLIFHEFWLLPILKKLGWLPKVVICTFSVVELKCQRTPWATQLNYVMKLLESSGTQV